MWHTSITRGQTKQIEHIQERVLRIIELPNDNLESLSVWRERQCITFFKNIFNDESLDNLLHKLLPEKKDR